MRVVVISDTHNQHNAIDLPDGDVLVHCGDATGRGTPQEVHVFLDWFASQNYKHKIFVAGNHDLLFEKSPEAALHLLPEGAVHYLQDSSIVIDGILFYGSPWQPEFCDWAFNLPRYGPELAEKWAMIPNDTEFLITHGPPRGVMDRTATGEKVGCYDLRERVKEVRPAVHAFGHIHECWGVDYKPMIGETLFLNASICNERYAPVHAPIVVEKIGDTWQLVRKG